MSDRTATAVDLSRRVYSIITQYVRRRTEEKSGITWDDFKDRRVQDPATGHLRLDVPQEYREKQEKVCIDAFLAMRACRSREDFVAYFTGTICAVPQFLPLADFQELAAALLGDDDRWEQVKALSMLALSAQSRV